MEELSIKNKEISDYRKYLDKIVYDLNIDKEIRQFAATKIHIINLLVDYYENDYEIEHEDFMWNEIDKPLLPEEMNRLMEKINKRIKR